MMSRDTNHADVVAVIRAAGERTFEACRALLAEQLPASAIEIVQARPFEAALRQTYEIGIRRGTTWMLTLDADVLLRHGAVQDLLSAAIAMPPECFQVEGRIFDKLTCRYRQAGHRVYRTSLLPLALPLVPAHGTMVRPEDTVIRRMAERGHPSRRVGTVVGVHDYEQFYRDVYRKSFVHANKHVELIGELAASWKSLAREDNDYRVALKGLCDGLLSVETAKIDIDAYPEDLNGALRDLGLTEKSSADSQRLTAEFIDDVLRHAGPPPEHPECEYPPSDQVGGVARRFQQLGPLRMIPFSIGRVFLHAARLFDRIAWSGKNSVRQ